MATVKTGQLYDIAEVIRTIYAATIKADPPRIAPAQLDPVLKYLEEVTAKSAEHAQRLSAQFAGQGGGDSFGREANVLQQVKVELQRWQQQLASYRLAINGCMVAQPQDPECTLWSVTAPLFFGIYDGPLGTSSPSAPSLRQPFQIANQLSELQHFVNTEWVDGWRYLGDETNKVFASIGEGVAGTLRLMGEAAGKTVGAAAGGLLGGLGGWGYAALAGLAAWWLWPKKEGA